MKRETTNFIIFYIFLLAIISFVSANTVSVVPPATNVNVENSFIVNVSANTSTSNLFSIQFDLNYNSSVLILNSVSEGSFLKSDGATTIFNYTSIGGGLARGVYGVRNKTFLDASPGINGNGSIAVLSFTAIASGNSGLNLSNVIWVNSSILNDSVANVVSAINNGSVVVNTPLQCQLTNANWSTNSAIENQTVTLTVQGTNCDGQSINFTVWEYDGGSERIIGGADDSVVPNPLNAVFSSGIATTTWKAQWQSDCGGLCNPPEYYFISTSTTNASKTITSNDPKMIVDKLVSQNEILIIPSTQNVNSGSSFLVEVRARVMPGNNFNAIQMDISYDSAILSVNSVTEGNMLNESGAVYTFFGYTLSSGLIDDLFVARNTSTGVTTNEGTIAIINFTAISGGTSYVNISNALWTNSTATNITVGQSPYIATNGSVSVSGGGGDTTPPIVSNGLPQSILPAGTTSAPINVTTNEIATCRWSLTPGVAYSSMINTFAGAGTTFHTSTRSGLSDGGSYTTYVRCQDSFGNTNLADYSFTFTVGVCIPTITVDSTYDASYSSAVIDDGTIAAFGGSSTTWASAESTTLPHWIEKTLCSPATYNNATIWWAWNAFRARYVASQEVYVQYYNGSVWQNITSLPYIEDNVSSSTVSFLPVTSNRWRLFQPANKGSFNYSRVIWLTEIELNYTGSACGNGIVDGIEQCDRLNLNGQTCTTQGFTSGTLSCTSSCTFNTTTCTSGVPPTLVIISPLNGSTTPNSNINITFNTTNWSVGGKLQDHIHFYLNSNPIPFMFYNGIDNVVEYNFAATLNASWINATTIQFNNLANGNNTVKGIFAKFDHSELTNSEATKTIVFNVNAPLICINTDGDGYNASSAGCGIVDCNDNNALEFPGQIWYNDLDRDRYGNGTSLTQCPRPLNYNVSTEIIATTGDCNNNNAAINPGATETCNLVDDNCNGFIDEGVTTNYYRDADGDTYGNLTNIVAACSPPLGYILNNADCNDIIALEHPGQTWYSNPDHDAYGNTTSTVQCLRPLNYNVSIELTGGTAGDCNNTNFNVNPGAIESAATLTCVDGFDNNCNGEKDWDTQNWVDGTPLGGSSGMHGDNGCAVGFLDKYGFGQIEIVSSQPYYENTFIYINCYMNADESVNSVNAYVIDSSKRYCSFIFGSGFGSEEFNCSTGSVGTKIFGCEVNQSRSYNSTGDATLTADIVQLCTDADADGYNTTTGGVCGTTADCNDANPSINPGVTEICNGIDDNCDTQIDLDINNISVCSVDNYYCDGDFDSYNNSMSSGNCSIFDCIPVGCTSIQGNDCDDSNLLINPGATEICNGVDDNCDAQIDEGVKNTYYLDNDSDSYGGSSSLLACTIPGGYSNNNLDCNDNDPAIHPEATEICRDGIDQDCSGSDLACTSGSSCVVTSLSWSNNSVSDGTTVTLNVQGANCTGLPVTFSVFEYDGFPDELVGGLDDSVNSNPLPTIFSPAGTAITSWTAEWQDDGLLGLGGDPEYYFILNINGTIYDIGKTSGQLLNVNLNQLNYQTINVPLQVGKNSFSLPVIPNDLSITSVFNSTLQSQADRIYTYNRSFEIYYFDGIRPSNLNTLEIGRGYVLFMNQAGVLVINGTKRLSDLSSRPTIQLTPGWNMIGTFSNDYDAKTILGNQNVNYSAIYAYDISTSRFIPISDTDLLKGEKSYWVYVEQPASFVPLTGFILQNG
ncbi:MAG: MopE-related protein [Nanoarchaeota archaeon]